MRKERGFTLIEILIGVAILAILAIIVVAAINPAERFKDARNTQRRGDIVAVMDAINLNMLDNNGRFSFSGCPESAFPTRTAYIADDAVATDTLFDICDCVVENYIGILPVDPISGTPVGGIQKSACTTVGYNTFYQILQSTTTGVITITAPAAEGETIRIAR